MLFGGQNVTGQVRRILCEGETVEVRAKLTASGAAKPSIGVADGPTGLNCAGSDRSQVDVDGVFVVAVTVAEPSVPDVGVFQVVSVGT